MVTIKKFVFAFLAVITIVVFSNFAYAQNEDICLSHTNQAIDKMTAITNEFNAFTDSVIKAQAIPNGQKSVFDQKLRDFENYLHTDPYIVYTYHHPNSPSGENDVYLNYNFENTGVGIQWAQQQLPCLIDYAESYLKAVRRYKINMLLYSGGYRDLAAYLSGYTKLPNGTYYLDSMKVTKKSDTYAEIDLTNAQLIITPGNSNGYTDGSGNYEFGTVTVIPADKKHKYLFTGYANFGDYNGYFIPTGRGLLLNCEYNGRKQFLLNTENKTALEDYEGIMLSDVFFNKYLKQSNLNWSYKGADFSGDGKGNYFITLPENTRYAPCGNIYEQYSEYAIGSSGAWLVMRERDDAEYSYSKHEYYWDTSNCISSAIADEIPGEDDIKIIYNDKTIHINNKNKQ